MHQENVVVQNYEQIHRHLLELVKATPGCVSVTVTNSNGGLLLCSLRLPDSVGEAVFRQAVDTELEWLRSLHPSTSTDDIITLLLQRQGVSSFILFGLIEWARDNNLELSKVVETHSQNLRTHLQQEGYASAYVQAFPIQSPPAKRRGTWRDKLISWLMGFVNRYPD